MSVRGTCYFCLNLSPKWGIDPVHCVSGKRTKQERGIVAFSSMYSLKGKVWSSVVLSMCFLTSAQQDTHPHGPVTVCGLSKRWLVCGSWFQWSITPQEPTQDFPGMLPHRRAWSRVRSPHLPEQHQDEISHQGEPMILPEEPETHTACTCLFTLCFPSISS